MFESLSARLQAIATGLRGKAKITEADLEVALREIRLALLEADVNYKVVKTFVAGVREKAIGTDALNGVQPGQQIVKIVHDELVEVLGGERHQLKLGAKPAVVMLVGLQGSGKTTTAAKLAVRLRKEGHRPLLVAADVYRPAAVDQLVQLGDHIGIEVHTRSVGTPALEVARSGLEAARQRGHDVVLLDTAGRLHVDEPMMDELVRVTGTVTPAETLLVVDAMTGQEAVTVAEAFHHRLPITGLVLTKMDGDARGGAALSIRSVTGLPISFIGTGERTDGLEPFHPDRLAQRILGMGDILSLVERVQETVDQDEAERVAQRMIEQRFTLEDFRSQLNQVKKMGPIGQVLQMIPGAGQMAGAAQQAVDDGQFKRIEAIIDSMTPDERRRPELIKASRRRRIALGSGTSTADVNRLLKQFVEMQKLMKQLGNGRLPNIGGLRGMLGALAGVLDRLIIALTIFIGLVGATVVAGYLTLFAAGSDRAARAVPADAVAYATVYLQPSTGQQMNLALMLGQVPGFSDAANLDQKIHEIAARFLGQAGIDYEADVRPWLGNQLSIALRPEAGDVAMPSPSLLAAVKDQAAAESGMATIAATRGLTGTQGTYRDTAITVADGLAWAVLEDLLIATTDRASLEAALDAEADVRPSLADDAGYAAAMRRLPADHLASAYLNLAGAAEQAGAEGQVGGYSTVSAALLAEPDGLRVDAIAPFDSSLASAVERADFAAGREPSTLAEWLPADTQASAAIFDVQRAARAAEDALGAQPDAQDIIDTLNQLRALAAFGLGIDLDRDVLGLFSAEAAIGLADVLTDAPHGQLLLRPPDAAVATATLERLRDAISAQGGQVGESEAAGLTITTVEVPQVGSVSWAVSDGVIVAGLTAEDVAAALAAHASGQTLAANARYRAAWELAGDRGGNEAFVDIGAIVDASDDALGTTGDARDILLTVGALGLTAPARDGNTELHIVLTVR